jgi:hypothetical protein
VLSATVMMEELDRFSPHSVTVTASFRRNLALLSGLATVQIIDADVGVIAWGVINNPQEQITRADAHTITLSLPNITEVLRYSTTGQGWAAGSNAQPLALATIVQRLASLHYGWSARCLDYGADPFILASDDATVLDALVSTATATFAHIRQGRDATGAPNRTMELFQTSAAPTLQLISPDGGNADDIVNSNPYARLVDSITRNPADCTKLVNAMTPLGGGSGSQQVRFRRLFKIIHDSTYEHFGQATHFPEYDPNFPLPALYNAAAGIWQPARLMKGDSNQYEIAARLDGGADGYEYHVVHLASLAAYNAQFPHEGEFRSQFSDSTFSYTTDATDITSQEQTERALYVAAKANLAWYGFPQRTVTVTTVGTGRPPRAGDQVTLGYRRIGADEQGPFAELDEGGTYTIVSVQRAYDALGVTTDTWTLTNNGKQPPNEASRARDTTRKLIEVVRSVPTTVAAPYQIASGVWDIDAIHPLTNYWEIPDQSFRVQQAKIRINLFPSRANVSVTDAPALNVTVPIPSLNVFQFAVPLHSHTGFTPLHGHGYGTPDHGHGYNNGVHTHVINATSPFIAPPAMNSDMTLFSTPSSGSVAGVTHTAMPNFTGANHTHGEQPPAWTTNPTVQTGGGVGGLGTGNFGASTATAADNGGQVVGVTTQATTSGTTATHSHTLLPGIFETNLPMRVGLYIDSGDGNLVDRSPELGGPWTATMRASVDISKYLVATTAGQTVRFQVVALTSSGNPTGLGRAELAGVGVLEMSSASATFFAA